MPFVIILLVIIVILLLPFGWLLLAAIVSGIVMAVKSVFSLLGSFLPVITFVLLVAALCLLCWFLWTIWGRSKSKKSNMQQRVDTVISTSSNPHEIIVTSTPTTLPNHARINKIAPSSIIHPSLKAESHMVDSASKVESLKPTEIKDKQV